MTQQRTRPDHDPDDRHEHGGHEHGDDFDWDALADSLELDAAITMPIVDRVLAQRSVGPATSVIDVGCGPGVVAVHIAVSLPAASVVAVDTSEALLARVERRATDAGVGARVRTVVADLEHALPDLPPADLVWASMVLHHVPDPVATLRHLRDRLRPGGSLVMVEFGNPPRVLPADDPLVVDGTWQRFVSATAASLNERLGLDPTTVDWPLLLGRAGFVDVTDANLAADHPAPLAPDAGAWLVKHIRRGIEMAGDRMGATDVTALEALADAVPTRNDLSVRAERRVLTARRP